MTEKLSLGNAPCIRCKALIEWRWRKDQRAYGYCKGDHDRTACGGMFTLGKDDSKRFAVEIGAADPPAVKQPAPPANDDKAPAKAENDNHQVQEKKANVGSFLGF